jgi:hypothetical protein
MLLWGALVFHVRGRLSDSPKACAFGASDVFGSCSSRSSQLPWVFWFLEGSLLVLALFRLTCGLLMSMFLLFRFHFCSRRCGYPLCFRGGYQFFFLFFCLHHSELGFSVPFLGFLLMSG